MQYAVFTFLTFRHVPCNMQTLSLWLRSLYHWLLKNYHGCTFNCTYDTEMKKWSSQLWTQFMQLRKEAWTKFRTSTGFEPVTSRLSVRCSTNWAMKPLKLGAGQLWVHVPVKEMSVNERRNKSYMNCGNEMKKWSNPIEVLNFFSGFFTQLHKLRSQLRWQLG